MKRPDRTLALLASSLVVIGSAGYAWAATGGAQIEKLSATGACNGTLGFTITLGPGTGTGTVKVASSNTTATSSASYTLDKKASTNVFVKGFKANCQQPDLYSVSLTASSGTADGTMRWLGPQSLNYGEVIAPP